MIEETGLGIAALNSIGLLSEQAMMASPEKRVDLSQVDVQIHVPTKDEEKYIQDTLRSITRQSHVRMGEVSVILVDSDSSDSTVQRAEPFVDEVWQAPDGKLNARNYAMDKTDADIVVSADAGDIYPEGWLSNLLEPFKRSDVVATHGPNCSQDPLWKPMLGVYNFFRPMGNFSASNSAVRTDAYWQAGGFDESVDQFERSEIFEEEEMKFPERLNKVGEVVYVPSAPMLTNMRHQALSLQSDNEYHQQRQEGNRF